MDIKQNEWIKFEKGVKVPMAFVAMARNDGYVICGAHFDEDRPLDEEFEFTPEYFMLLSTPGEDWFKQLRKPREVILLTTSADVREERHGK